ncbi:MAG TPA: hypothetical protein VIM37_01745 [Candidatus Microsaccharimonas sp.]|jgi:hypothetical protein
MEKDLSVENIISRLIPYPKKYENVRDTNGEPLTNEHIVLGEDVYPSNPDLSLPKQSDDLTVSISTLPELAGSFAELMAEQTHIKHVNIGRALLQRQARDVATMAFANPVRVPEFYEKLRTDVESAVNDGVLDLVTKYPDVQSEARIGLYTKEILTQQLQTPTNVLLADVHPELISNEIGVSPDRFHELEIDNKRLLKERQAQQKTILDLRALRIAEGASADELHEFDQVAKLLTAPEREAYEHGSVHNSRTLTELFKSIVRPLISRKALEAIGIVSPRSAEFAIISHQEKTSA